MTQTLLTKLNNALLYQMAFYKHFYKFMFLHKPLCPRYKNFSIKIGNMYFCRSCFLLYCGFFIALLQCIPGIKTIEFGRYFIIGLIGALTTLIASYPSVYSRFKRSTKDFIRFYDGIFLAIFLTVAFKINIYIGILAVISFIIVRNLYNRVRFKHNLCEGCEHLSNNKTCVGYIQQKEALLKIEEEYSNIRTKQILKKGQ